jgi:hypothetical protein
MNKSKNWTKSGYGRKIGKSFVCFLIEFLKSGREEGKKRGYCAIVTVHSDFFD